ncbi:NAD(P)H-binding protein [Streptomyces sp. NPDC020719]|uniref:SDR family oxidoreductase n=1 Tax=unclassified Streptomyces TaxID=2593676 RepID=UPI0033BFCEF0
MTILVTGATGNIGGKVLARLLAAGHPVRALTRDPSRARLPAGVEVVGADMGRPDTLPDALDGVRAVFLMSLGHNKRTHDAQLIEVARKTGVEHIVQLSTLGVAEVEEENDTPLGLWHRQAERALTESGIAWTILRPNGFMTHALGWRDAVHGDGVVRSPVADLPEALIDPRDIADVAVRALTEPGHQGRVYALTGPEALTAREQVAVVGSVLGKRLRFEQISIEEHHAVMARQYGEETADGVVVALRKALESGDDFRGRLFPDVQQVLGRPGHSFREWVEAHTADFA